MNQCAKCRRRLKPDALRCICGWSASFTDEAKPVALCAHEGCGVAALVRLKTETGWANFCVPHYGAYWTPDRVAKHRPNRGERDNPMMKEIRAAYLRSRAHERKHASAREPGSDDGLDEMADALADRMAA